MQAFNAEVGRITGEVDAIKEGLRSVVAAGERPVDVIADAMEEAFSEADRDYQAALEERDRKLTERRSELHAQLFGAPSGAAGPAFTNALTQAANADDDQLTALAELAATTGDSTLGRAVFAAAVQRGRADLGLAWLEANPEAREAFAELGSMPTAEELERGRNFKFPRPSMEFLRPQAHEIMQAELVERGRRVERAMRDTG